MQLQERLTGVFTAFNVFSDQRDSNERNKAETTREDKKGWMRGRYGNKTATREAGR